MDHVVELEIVTAGGNIVRASENQNSDLFWAAQGAGGSYGVITEFVMRTHPDPGKVVQYSYVYSFGGPEHLAKVFKLWQDVVTDPSLDRRFGSELTFHTLGAMISGTFYGTKQEFEDSGILNKLPHGGKGNYVVTSFLGSLATRAEHAAVRLSNMPVPFYSKSLGFKADEILSYEAILRISRFVDTAYKRTPLWFIIFSATGAAVSDVPMNATAYAHRDKIIFYESYVIGPPLIPGGLPASDRQFLADFHEVVQAELPGGGDSFQRTYPGYVDRSLPDGLAQAYYWGSNLPRLEQIKRKWDPVDMFHNPQSVRPAALGTVEEGDD